MPQQNKGGSNMGADKKVSEDASRQRPGNKGQDANKKQDGDKSSGQRSTDQQKAGSHADAAGRHSVRTSPDSGNARGNNPGSGRKGDAAGAEAMNDSEEGSGRKNERDINAPAGADPQARKTSNAPGSKSSDNTKSSR